MTTSNEKEFKLWGAPRRLWECWAPKILLDGPGRTGKTFGDCAFCHCMAMANAGARILWVRQTRISMNESVLQTFEDWVLDGNVKMWFGEVKRGNRQSYDYANGAKIVLGGLDKPEGLYSTEWDIVVVFEAIETSADDVERFVRGLSGRGIPLMTTDGEPVLWPDGTPVYRRQLIQETNPGAPGHWLNKRATAVPDDVESANVGTSGGRIKIDQWNARKPEVSLTDEPDINSKPIIHRLLSRHCDNPRWFDGGAWTSDGKALLASLASMTGHRRARLFEGRWVAAEGSVFGASFLQSRNVCKRFPIPKNWPIWFYLDPGRDHPCGAFWVTMSPTGKKFIIGEIYVRGEDIAQISARIHEREAKEGWNPIGRYLDPRYGFSSTAFARNGETIAEQFHYQRLAFSPWPPLQKEGKDAAVNQVSQELAAGLLIYFEECVNTISETQSWSYKRNVSGEQMSGDDQYEDKDNHLLDPIIGMAVMELKFSDGSVQAPPAAVDYGEDEQEENQ